MDERDILKQLVQLGGSENAPNSVLLPYDQLAAVLVLAAGSERSLQEGLQM